MSITDGDGEPEVGESGPNPATHSRTVARRAKWDRERQADDLMYHTLTFLALGLLPGLVLSCLARCPTRLSQPVEQIPPCATPFLCGLKSMNEGARSRVARPLFQHELLISRA